jgi:D-aspartate ligase
MFSLRDQVAAFQLALAGRLNFGSWLASLTRTGTFASFSLKDPLPGVVEIPLTIWRVIARFLGSSR